MTYDRFSHEDDDADAVPYTLADLAYSTGPGEKPRIGQFGCVILSDGTTHTLRRQHTHGMLLALLFPEKAAAAGYAPPDTDSRVLHYQHFELDHQATLPAVRIATGGLLSNINVSKSHAPATAAQVASATAYLQGMGLKPADKVHLDLGEVSFRKLQSLLALDDDAMRQARYN
jgi:hypothetical protein